MYEGWATPPGTRPGTKRFISFIFWNQKDYQACSNILPRLAFSSSQKLNVELPACGSDTTRTVCIDVPKLVFNPRLPLKTDDWEKFAHLTPELMYPGSELPTVIHVPVREIESSFYIPITRGLL